MALDPNFWYRITLKPFTDPAWGTLITYPLLQPGWVEAILDGTTVQVYALSGPSPATLLAPIGRITIPASLVATESVVVSESVTNEQLEEISISRTVDGGSYWYNLNTGVLTTFSAGSTLAINGITAPLV